jgi:hypothetical protein
MIMIGIDPRRTESIVQVLPLTAIKEMYLMIHNKFKN